MSSQTDCGHLDFACWLSNQCLALLLQMHATSVAKFAQAVSCIPAQCTCMCKLGRVCSERQLTETSCADVQELANAVYAKLQSWVDQFVYRR